MNQFETLLRRDRPVRAASTVLAASVLAFAVSAIASCVGDDPSTATATTPDSAAPVDGSTLADTGAAPVDAAIDTGALADAAPAPDCDPMKPFDPAVSVSVIGVPTANEHHAVLSDDELTIFFASDRQQANHYRIFSASRPSRTAPFSTPSAVALVNGGEADNPTVSGDGNTLFFDSAASTAPIDAGMGYSHIFTATRNSRADNFGTATAIVASYVTNASLTAGGSAIYALDLVSGAVARLPKNGNTYGPQANLANTGDYTGYSPLSRDDLTLYISEGRPGSAFMGGNIWVYTRPTTAMPYGATPVELKSVNTDGDERPTWLSADGCRLYIDYVPMGGTTSDIYVATRPH